MALIGSQEPVLYAANPVTRAVEGSIDYSLGEQRVQFLKAAGMTLFPWQSGFVREFSATATIVDPDDASIQWVGPAYTNAVEVVSRQNGKGEELIGFELSVVYSSMSEKSILHTAHYGQTVLKAQNRTWEVIENSKLLMEWPAWVKKYGRRGARPTKVTSNGKEAIRFPNGSIVKFSTRSGTSGAGTSNDVLVLDECFDLPEGTADALTYTTRARQGAQTIWISSPFNKLNPQHLHGEMFSGQRWAAIDGAPGILFREWSLPEDVSPFERRAWEMTNPSLKTGPGPGKEFSEVEAAAEAAQSSESKLRSFLVEDMGRGNWHPRETDETELAPVIADEDMDEVMTGEHVALSHSTVSVDVTPDRAMCSIALAGQAGDKIHGMVGFHSEFSVPTVVDALMDVLRKANPTAIVIDPQSPAVVLIEHLESLGFDVQRIGFKEAKESCVEFLQGIDDRLYSISESDMVREGIQSAELKETSDGGVKWARRSGVICQVVALSNAMWAVRRFAPVEGKKKDPSGVVMRRVKSKRKELAF